MGIFDRTYASMTVHKMLLMNGMDITMKISKKFVRSLFWGHFTLSDRHAARKYETRHCNYRFLTMCDSAIN